jgi:hypothetical protein
MYGGQFSSTIRGKRINAVQKKVNASAVMHGENRSISTRLVVNRQQNLPDRNPVS